LAGAEPASRGHLVGAELGRSARPSFRTASTVRDQVGGEAIVMYGHWDGGWWGFGMMLFSLLFLALIVVGVVFVVRSFSDGGRSAHQPAGNRALDILDERFARGEIDQAEYEERRRTLTSER